MDGPDLCTIDVVIHLVWKTRHYQFVDARLSVSRPVRGCAPSPLMACTIANLLVAPLAGCTFQGTPHGEKYLPYELSLAYALLISYTNGCLV